MRKGFLEYFACLECLMMMMVEKKGGPLLLVFCHSESSPQGYSSHEWLSIADPVGLVPAILAASQV